MEEYLKPRKEELYTRWERVAEREKRSRTMFAQEWIRVEDVKRELVEERAAIGLAEDVATFTVDALRAYRAVVSESGGRFRIDLREVSRSLRDVLQTDHTFDARFELPVTSAMLPTQGGPARHPLCQDG